MRESGFAGKRGLIEKRGGSGTEAARLKIAALVEKQETLIEIEKPGPDEIFFGSEHGASFGETLKGVDGFSLLAVSDGFIGERFRGLVTHAEFFKSKEAFLGHFAGFFTEIQLEINFGKIEVAKSEMVGVAGGFAGAARGEEHFDGAAILTAKIVEIGDVVIGLIAKQRHVVADAKLASFLVTIEGLGEIVQADEAHGHVVESDGDALPILVFGKDFVGALVVEHRLFEAVLAMEDVADVVVEAGDTASFAEFGEDFPGTFGGFEGAIVFAEQNERLNGAAEGARGFFPDFERFVNGKGLLVMLNGGAVVAASVERIGFRADGEGEIVFPAKLAADEDGGFGKTQRFVSIDADFFEDEVGELLEDFAADERFVARKKFEAVRLVFKTPQLR